MQGWSFSVGKVFGVEVRIHLLFPLLLALCVGWASAVGRPGGRGVLLWALLVLAVAVREIARALAAAWCGMEMRTLLVLPSGGLPEYRPGASQTEGARRVLALAGPVASFVFGLTTAGLVLAVAPEVDLTELRWVTPVHLLRSAVWINLLLGAVNLLPAWPLDGGRTEPAAEVEGAPAAPAGGLRTALPGGKRMPGLSRRGSPTMRLAVLLLSLALVIAGIVTTNWWMLGIGMALLFSAQADRQGLLTRGGMEAVQVRDVMLTGYTVLSASATLEDAMIEARHTLQDVFPVVRGGSFVGAIGRQAVLEAVEGNGNSYVQGSMMRSFQTATANEPLMPVLNRVTAAGGQVSQLIPVLDGDRVIGILTPENLHRSMAIMSRDALRRQAEQLRDEER